MSDYGKIHGFAIVIILIFLKRLVTFFMLLDAGVVSRPSWRAKHVLLLHLLQDIISFQRISFDNNCSNAYQRKPSIHLQ